MKKHGILNSQLIGELTKVRHQEKIVLCDAGLPVPRDKTLVDVSLVAGLPTVEQVFRAVCNEMLLESILVPEVFIQLRPDFWERIQRDIKEQELKVVPNETWSSNVYGDDVVLYVRTGDVLPCSNIILTSASGVPRHYARFNMHYDDVTG